MAAYIHMQGKVGVLVEVNCETDFVAKNDSFRDFVKDITLHIAAASPQYVDRDEVPAAQLEKERDIARSQVLNKPANVVEKIVEGKIDKFYSTICLLDQGFIKATDNQTVRDLVKSKIAELGENIVIRRFTRYMVGEAHRRGQGRVRSPGGRSRGVVSRSTSAIIKRPPADEPPGVFLFCAAESARGMIAGNMMPAMLLEEPTIMERAMPITVEQYHALFAQGLIPEKVELLEGIIVEKMSKSPLHSFVAAEAIEESLRAAAAKNSTCVRNNRSPAAIRSRSPIWPSCADNHETITHRAIPRRRNSSSRSPFPAPKSTGAKRRSTPSWRA